MTTSPAEGLAAGVRAVLAKRGLGPVERSTGVADLRPVRLRFIGAASPAERLAANRGLGAALTRLLISRGISAAELAARVDLRAADGDNPVLALAKATARRCRIYGKDMGSGAAVAHVRKFAPQRTSAPPQPQPLANADIAVPPYLAATRDQLLRRLSLTAPSTPIASAAATAPSLIAAASNDPPLPNDGMLAPAEPAQSRNGSLKESIAKLSPRGLAELKAVARGGIHGLAKAAGLISLMDAIRRPMPLPAVTEEDRAAAALIDGRTIGA